MGTIPGTIPGTGAAIMGASYHAQRAQTVQMVENAPNLPRMAFCGFVDKNIHPQRKKPVSGEFEPLQAIEK